MLLCERIPLYGILPVGPSIAKLAHLARRLVLNDIHELIDTEHVNVIDDP